jgi:hypothetical protein
MSRLPLLFMVTAAACMTGGVCLGIMMGILHDFSLAPVHAHLNLLGWASLALMGLTLRAWPVLAEGRLAALQYLLSASAALCFAPGVYLAIRHGQPGLAIAAGFVWLAGTLLFLARLVHLLLHPVPRRAGLAVAAE